MNPTEDEREELVSKGLPRLILLLGVVVALGVWGSFSALVIVIALVVMIFLHELGHYVMAKAAGMKVTEFFIGFGPRIWSFRRGETEYGVKAIPAGAYVRIIGMTNLEEVEPADEERTYRSKPYWRRLSVAVAGSTMHFILALGLIYAVFVGFGMPDFDSDRWSIGFVDKGSAASDVGLQVGDRIVSVDGRTFVDYDELTTYMRARPGETVAVVVDRDGQRLALDAELDRKHPNGDEVGYLGVGPRYDRIRSGPAAGVADAVDESLSVGWESIRGIGSLFSRSGVEGYVENLTGAEDADPAKRPTSVVGIVDVGAQVARDGMVNVLYLLFAVNVFIGVFNLAPLLPFDGGHVVIATYEKIRSMISGRRYYADITKLMPLTYVVVLVLALLFVTTIYLDIADPQSVR